MLSCPLYAGLRACEVAGLDVDDMIMSARKGSLWIVGKGTKVRTVPVNQTLREALSAAEYDVLRAAARHQASPGRSLAGRSRRPDAAGGLILALQRRSTAPLTAHH